MLFHVPIILCTGFTRDLNEDVVLCVGITALCMKPIRKTEIAEKIRVIFDTKAAKT